MNIRMASSCTAVAPSSTANLGPGYDVFGLGLDALEDTVRITKASGRTRRITIRVSGEKSMSIPSVTESNSAGLVIKKMSEDFDIHDDLNINIVKRVPAGFGIGSSAASAALPQLHSTGYFISKSRKQK